jgi:molecular chaperone GrpE
LSKKKQTITPETEPEIINEEQQTENAVVEPQEEQYILTAEEFKAAKEHIEGLQKEKDELVDLLRRNQADFDNFRRRNTNAWGDGFAGGKRESVLKFLPVLDDFERIQVPPDSALGEGINMVKRKLIETICAMGAQEIPTDGAFDPALHQAVQTVAAEDNEPGQIAMTFQKGYIMDGRVIRHSMVVVTE